MGRRDVTVYTCDGCKVSATVRRTQPAGGFHRIVLKDQDRWVCSVCYAAVEWVVQFQGVMMPPKVYGSGSRWSLRPGEAR